MEWNQPARRATLQDHLSAIGLLARLGWELVRLASGRAPAPAGPPLEPGADPSHPAGGRRSGATVHARTGPLRRSRDRHLAQAWWRAHP